MADFLAENNLCGQNLLRIVSMGNSIIAEVLRLKDYVPDIFRLETKDQQKYGEIILDFSYFQIAEAHEKKIESSKELQDLDDEIRENFLELLTRFYLAFESTHKYCSELQHYVNALNSGHYIQQSLESVLQDPEGKQLMCESLYLFGVILLILDLHIPGLQRERLLIAYYRYSASKSHGDSNIDDVCMLLRSTGYTSTNAATTAGSRPNVVDNYPEAYFSRCTFDQIFIDMVIGRLRSDDLYNQLSIYPHPDHRATALSSQAGMLYVCLFFSANILHSQVVQMREIVDKFFANNWVISIYMGITVNLIDAWDQFKAARSALTSTVESAAIMGSCLLYSDKFNKVLQQTKEILRDGVLSEVFVLQNITKIINLIRECNVSLRWYLMHTSNAAMKWTSSTSKRVQQIQELVKSESKFKEIDLFELLINCSELELLVKEILRDLMQEKNMRWNGFKDEAAERLNELSEAFSGLRPMAKIESNTQLKEWFAELAKEISKLSIETPKVSGRTIVQLIQALEEVQEFHNLQSNMQVKQNLKEARDYLHRMMQIINVKEDILISIQLISDLSYAWHIVDNEYTVIMQDSIKKQPRSVIKLRAIFLKLASALEIPLLRINQAKSEDLVSVSNYYSTELANYIRKVVQIIPETMFNILARIIYLETEVLIEIPTRLEKNKIKEYMQPEDRYTVAKLTCSVAVFTEGILMMKKTLVGVIELDPKQLLEDGIRKELVRNLANALNIGLIFSEAANKPKPLPNDIESKLVSLAKTIDGYRRSFEYIQDYLHVHGLKILQEEFTRIINYNVEKECNAFLGQKQQDWQSQYQSHTVPIPNFPTLQGDITNSNNFIGRLAHEILLYTDPKHTIYLELKTTWYEKRAPQKKVLDGRIFCKVREAIGPAGLVGLDRLYSYILIDELERNLDKIQKNFTNDKMWIAALTELQTELEAKNFPINLGGNPLKFYADFHTCWFKVWPTILNWLLKLGHIQILRQHLAYELDRSSTFNSKNLKSALETFNRALLNELEMCAATSQKAIKPSDGLIADVNEYLLYVGEYDPLEQIGVITKNSHNIALFLFLFTIAHLSRIKFSTDENAVLPKNPKEHLDEASLVIGILTVLKQFHNDLKMLYLTYLCQYVSALVESNLSSKHDICAEAVNALNYLEAFVRTARLPRSELTERIPSLILNQVKYLASNDN